MIQLKDLKKMEQNTTPQPAANNGKGLGIAGMILGILAIIISFVFEPFYLWMKKKKVLSI